MIRRLFNRLKTRETRLAARAWRDISTPEARKQARFHFNWIDHGILRIHWKNFHRIAPDVYRANQPSPKRLAEWQGQGIRSILNLRGESEYSPWLLEAEACKQLGLKLVDHRIYASALASREEILELIEIMRSIEKPFVMHCKSGSDRTGFAAVLYLHLFCDLPLAEAMRQLHWRHFHLRGSKNGILDLFFEAYQQDAATSGKSLIEWIRNDYDRDSLTAKFAIDRGRGG